MRQIVLDTETTGLEPEQGHRVIEIGGVEIIDRRLTGKTFHRYLNPGREIDDAAIEVHGLTNRDLEDKPPFSEVAGEFLEFIRGAELIIHNAPFDVSFLNYELSILDSPTRLADLSHVTDSLAMARHKHPGQKNSLDALCRRYDVDNSARELHGALLDAEILADVYLAMTGGQTSLFTTEDSATDANEVSEMIRLPLDREPLLVVRASVAELERHERYLDALDETSDHAVVWRNPEVLKEAIERLPSL